MLTTIVFTTKTLAAAIKQIATHQLSLRALSKKPLTQVKPAPTKVSALV